MAELRDFPAWPRVGSDGCWVGGIPTSTSRASQQQLQETPASYSPTCFFSRCIYRLKQSDIQTGNHLLLTVRDALWMRSVRFDALGIALETPIEVEGLHLIETRPVESETRHYFPLREHYLSNKQMWDCGIWQTDAILWNLKVWEAAGQGFTTDICISVSLITLAFSSSQQRQLSLWRDTKPLS